MPDINDPDPNPPDSRPERAPVNREPDVHDADRYRRDRDQFEQGREYERAREANAEPREENEAVRANADTDNRKNSGKKNGGRKNGDKKKNGKKSDDKKNGDDSDSDSDEDKKSSKLKNPKVRIGLIILAIVILVAGAIWFWHYWTVGRYMQSTDDAFLQADQVVVSSKIPGYVEEVLVESNQQVEEGQPLARINPQDSRATRDAAQAQVAQGNATIVQVEAQIKQQRSQISAADAQVRGARSTLRNAQVQFDRYTQLSAIGAQTAEQLTQMRQMRDQAAAALSADQAQRQSASRQIETLQAQIGVAKAQIQAAEAQLQKAEDDLSDTTVRSSIAGRVGDKSVRVGQYVQPSTRLMSIVPVRDLYAVANFKETQIGLMRVGQPVTVEVDALSGETLRGEVESFAPGTGAQFALLPPQNATGNFTKIVQRVPVRIHVDQTPEARKVLLPGLSVTVTINTLGSKAFKDKVDNEAGRRENQRKEDSQEAVRRDRNAAQPGPGQ